MAPEVVRGMDFRGQVCGLSGAMEAKTRDLHEFQWETPRKRRRRNLVPVTQNPYGY
ncbi:Hypothetical predicted protein [Marmota monax]|uniref:Uncharacterized protein n=1 Tax=Marmota monax TaxID=9995 RepID=A0A5E4A3E0_MARMO|nr:hypothetical protein GHT09_019669 [Marmota monax]VTJ51594.1 Hypothetical predicted protein [Marmota monax]